MFHWNLDISECNIPFFLLLLLFVGVATALGLGTTGGDLINFKFVAVSSVFAFGVILTFEWFSEAFGAFLSTISPGYWSICFACLHQPTGKMSRDVKGYQHWLDWPQPSKVIKILSRFTSFIVAGQIKSGFFGSTASILQPTLNSFLMGFVGGVLKQLAGAKTFSSDWLMSFSRNLGHFDSSLPYPSGGWILRLLLPAWPYGWMRSESIMSQKSFLSSVPSSLRRILGPLSSMMVPRHVDVVFLGSNVSSFWLTSNSLIGGSFDWQKQEAGAAVALFSTKYSDQEKSSSWLDMKRSDIMNKKTGKCKTR